MRRFDNLLLVVVFLFSCLNFGNSELTENENVKRIPRQFLLKRECSDNKNDSWECDNNQMIECGTVCDGKADCQDKSDETAFACRSYYCADDRFRCAYGGCISAEKECDGHRDCADNSDELTLNCPGVVGNLTKAGSCLEGFFQCQPNECIFEESLCDGAKDCIGGEDETQDQCSNHYCPEPNFRCDYGGCILPEFKCDSKIDCADESDESENLCGIERHPFNAPVPAGMTNFPETEDDLSLVEDNNGDRQTFGSPVSVPINEGIIKVFPMSSDNNNEDYRQLLLKMQIQLLENQIKLLRFLYPKGPTGISSIRPETPINVLPKVIDPPLTSTEAITNSPRSNFKPTTPGYDVSNNKGCKYEPTANIYHWIEGRSTNNIGNGDMVQFKCNGLTSLVGVNSTICINGELLDDPPTCERFCSTIPLNTLSVKPTCRKPSGETIPCTSRVSPQTVAILECKEGYKKPERDVNDTITCQKGGNWSSRVFKCEQICGTVAESEANIAKTPWHTAIYQQQNEKFVQICGGTIINPTAIVTAAHCFWDGLKQKVNSPDQYQVVVGKTFRDFESPEASVQRFGIKKIDVYDQYKDFNGLYVSDIAVVVLNKPINFQAHIKPICIQYNMKNNERYVQSGITGRVAGWGLSTLSRRPSTVLKIIDLPTVDYNTCYRNSPPEFRQFITSDKFCAGFTTGQSVCVGDSGGGLVFEKKFQDNSSAFYLRGIVSSGPRQSGRCDNHKYSAFTDVQLNIKFLYKYIIGS